MAITDYAVMEKLTALWKQIENTHFSYLETDDSPEKLDQRKKLEGYILDYLCLVPHGSKFLLQETGRVLSQSALSNPTFSAYRLAHGWTALARFAGNLLSQPWRKEYTTIQLYSGFYKHEIEGSGLCEAVSMLCAMGYKGKNTDRGPINTYVLDGPVCPDRVAVVSRDSLIAYVECQLMTQIWEEISMRGGSCTWLDIMRCREAYPGGVDQAVSLLLHAQRTGEDIYCNVKFPNNTNSTRAKDSYAQGSTHSNNHMSQSNGHIGNVMHNNHFNNTHQFVENAVYSNGQEMSFAVKSNGTTNSSSYAMYNNQPNHHGLYLNHQVPNSAHHSNGVIHNGYPVNEVFPNHLQMVNNFGSTPNYYYNPMLSYTLPSYIPMNHANNVPYPNNFNCSAADHTSYCPNIKTEQLIELSPTNYIAESKHNCSNLPISPKRSQYHANDRLKPESSHNLKDYHTKSQFYNVDSVKSFHKKTFDPDFENYENSRRNSAPRSIATNSNDRSTCSLPRSDTQPSLSKAREDGTGTFESWDYVYRKLESQQDPGEFGDLGMPSSSYDRESKTLGRMGSKDSKKYIHTTMDLEDALRVMSLEKNSDEEVFRNAKIQETLLKKKLESDAKAAKANLKRQILADEREKRKSNSHDMNIDGYMHDPTKINDKTRLISKEDYKCKKEMDKEVMNTSNNNLLMDNRKNRKSIVKCLSSDLEKNSKKKFTESLSSTVSRKHILSDLQSSQTNQRPGDRMDVDQGSTRLIVTLDNEPMGRSSKNAMDKKWECAYCTYLNAYSKKACEMCGKSRQVGAEVLPLTSGGKECPKCTLVNQRESAACEACGESLKNSPTYI